MRTDPILEPMPGAVELAKSETAGTKFAFGTPARVEVVWGVPVAAVEAADYYLERYGEGYRLRQHPNDLLWSGSHSVERVGIGVSVRVYGSLDEVEWDTQLTEETAVTVDWEGTVVVVGVSSSTD
jgi:hypothetical protein